MIYLINYENRHLFEDVLDEMFQQRKALFIDRLRWDLEHQNGLEKDAYDTEDTIYLVSVCEETHQIKSSVRLNPTDKPHLMVDHFAEYCAKGVPQGEDVWEISRYCYNPDIKLRETRLEALRECLCGIMECALLYGWSKLTFIIGMAILPHCLRSGWDMRPLGIPDDYGRETIAAFEVNVTPVGLMQMRDRADFKQPLLKIVPARSQSAA